MADADATALGELLGRVIEGAAAAAVGGGCLIAGGHSIDDPEPKFGLAVVGVVHPDRILTNSGALSGDDLILTKPVGVGAITTAVKRGLADAAHLAAAVEVMTTLNAGAAAAVREVGIGANGPVHAGTDITGFGLLGHLLEVTLASGVSAQIDIDAVRDRRRSRPLGRRRRRRRDATQPRVGCPAHQLGTDTHALPVPRSGRTDLGWVSSLRALPKLRTGSSSDRRSERTGWVSVCCPAGLQGAFTARTRR